MTCTETNKNIQWERSLMHHFSHRHYFFFKYIHGFTRKILKTSCFASRPALPGHRWILSDFLLNARRSRSVVFPLWHVALDLGGDRRCVWIQWGAGVRLLQARGAPRAAAQEFQAPLFQEADVHLVAGFLRGVRGERGSGHCHSARH